MTPNQTGSGGACPMSSGYRGRWMARDGRGRGLATRMYREQDRVA
jgi:hypothetical protein